MCVKCFEKANYDIQLQDLDTIILQRSILRFMRQILPTITIVIWNKSTNSWRRINKELLIETGQSRVLRLFQNDTSNKCYALMNIHHSIVFVVIRMLTKFML